MLGYYYKLEYTLIVPNTQAAVSIQLLLGNLEQIPATILI